MYPTNAAGETAPCVASFSYREPRRLPGTSTSAWLGFDASSLPANGLIEHETNCPFHLEHPLGLRVAAAPSPGFAIRPRQRRDLLRSSRGSPSRLARPSSDYYSTATVSRNPGSVGHRSLAGTDSYCSAFRTAGNKRALLQLECAIDWS